MPRLIVTALALFCMFALACKSKPKNEMADVPPPPPALEPVSFEPIGPVSQEMGSSVTVEETTIYSQNGASSETVTFEESTSSTSTSAQTYTVQKGDTLWKIAQRFYNNGQRWQDIAAANPDVNPQKLYVGTELTLP